MSDLYDQIVGQRGRLENLISRIPGFRGYNNKADRRTADRMLRDHIAGEVGKCLSRLTSLEKRLLDNGGLSYMTKTRSVKTKMQTFHDRIKAAAPGYSGFFEAMKVGDEELQSLYSFDEAQIRYVDRFDEALGTLESAINAQEGIDEALVTLESVTAEANEAFSLREDVLTKLDKAL